MSENLTLALFVTAAVTVGIVVVALVGVLIDRIFTGQERAGGL